MSERKPCPFCGSEPHASYVAVSCRNEECIANAANDEPTIGLIEAWNTRPIEDALNARIAELEKDLSNKEIEYTDLWDDALALQSRIAELEAESERFTVHSDIKRQDDKWIPVSERLPLLRDSKAVLVYTKSGETYSGLYLGNNEWTGLLHDFREGEVTHWMPLPSAPESEDE